MRLLRFALGALVRDAKAGELGVLMAAIVVAVAAQTAVGFFTDRIGQGIRQQAGAVLAADLRLESGRPLEPEASYGAEARARGLAVVRLVGFASVVYAGEASQLASVVGAGEGYPLRGQLKVAAAPYQPGRPVSGIPARGEAWADPRLLARLGVPVGGTLALGALTVRVGAVLDYRPDQGTSRRRCSSTPPTSPRPGSCSPAAARPGASCSPGRRRRSSPSRAGCGPTRATPSG